MSKMKALVAILVGVGLVAVVAVRAQRDGSHGAGNVMALTAMDYIQIKQLVNRYAFALDTGAHNGYDYADLFTADGVFDSLTRGRTQGRDQLAALARGGKKGPQYINHYIMNHIIEPTADGAIGRQYLIEISHDEQAQQGADGGPVNQWTLVGQKRGSVDQLGGQYEDIYAKTPAGWRFKYRTLVASKSGPDPSRVGTLKMMPVKADATDTVPAVTGGLSAMDYIEIERLVASYGLALDNGYGTADNGEAYSGLYTPDATFGQSTGHAQLAALGREQPQGTQYVRHYLTNHVIEAHAGQAIGKQYLVVIDLPEADARAKGAAGTIFLGGHYEDVYQRTQAGWRIRTRRLFRVQAGATPPVLNRPAPLPAAK
jgi:SnoaL-like domain